MSTGEWLGSRFQRSLWLYEALLRPRDTDRERDLRDRRPPDLERDRLFFEGLLDLDPLLWLLHGDLDLLCLFDDFASFLLCGDLDVFLFFLGDFTLVSDDLGCFGALS